MKKQKWIHIVFLLICCIVIAGAAFFLGYRTACNNVENPVQETFYAEISDIQKCWLAVKGLEVNDINFRGNFTFSVKEETRIIWRNTDIPFENLEVGDRVAITFTGDIMESEPARIAQVEQIQVLDDDI